MPIIGKMFNKKDEMDYRGVVIFNEKNFFLIVIFLSVLVFAGFIVCFFVFFKYFYQYVFFIHKVLHIC